MTIFEEYAECAVREAHGVSPAYERLSGRSGHVGPDDWEGSSNVGPSIHDSPVG
jgi:hypothetical protein